MLAGIKGWHGKFGHFNVLKLDHVSPCTGRGRHDRVMGYCVPAGDMVADIRIDHVWALGMPTEKQILAACRADGEMRGRWRLVEIIDDTRHPGEVSWAMFERKS